MGVGRATASRVARTETWRRNRETRKHVCVCVCVCVCVRVCHIGCGSNQKLLGPEGTRSFASVGLKRFKPVETVNWIRPDWTSFFSFCHTLMESPSWLRRHSWQCSWAHICFREQQATFSWESGSAQIRGGAAAIARFRLRLAFGEPRQGALQDDAGALDSQQRRDIINEFAKRLLGTGVWAAPDGSLFLNFVFCCCCLFELSGSHPHCLACR